MGFVFYIVSIVYFYDRRIYFSSFVFVDGIMVMNCDHNFTGYLTEYWGFVKAQWLYII